MSANVMHLTLHPNAFTDATLELIQRPISVSDVAIPAVQVLSKAFIARFSHSIIGL